MKLNRRQLLQTGLCAGISLGADWGFLSKLHPVSAADAKLDPSLVRADSGIEPTVNLLESTPRDRVLEEVAARIKSGLSYRELLASLLLAGVRNVQPRPQVGFKFHAVLVINSAHLASLASPDSDRWLPIFWAIDRFKSAQLETQKANGWKMSPVDVAKLPAPSKARESFIRAMDEWNESEADAAAAALARSGTRDEAFELFARYGCRDFRDIGHKAIFVANSFRTLDCIGWHHAESVLRSLAYALLKFDGDNPAHADSAPDRPWRRNIDLSKQLRPDWLDGSASPPSAQLLSHFRTDSDADSSASVVAALNDGVSPNAIWDAILAGAGEMLMRKTGIVTLHAVTSANALRYTYQTSADPQTRQMLLLQAAAFLPLFRAAAGPMAATKIDELEATAPSNTAAAAIDDIFSTADHDRPASIRKTLGYLDSVGDPTALMTTARRLVFLKGNDAHDYKFSSAVFEDYYHLAPAMRNRFLASALSYLPSSGAADSKLIPRIRAALPG
jgi:hypothetical protein